MKGNAECKSIWTVGLRNDVATTLPLGVFTRRNFAADFFRQKFDLIGTGVKYVHGLSIWLIGKRVVDFLLVLIELFSPALTVEALLEYTG